mgnify:CR=1 FL=1
MEMVGYRECIGILTERGCPALMRQKDAAKVLGISERHMRDLVREKKIKTCGTMVPIGAIARVICG